MPNDLLPPARTYLFVPGTRPERFDRALASGADRVVLDLEDAVAPDDKATARSVVATWLQSATPAGHAALHSSAEALHWARRVLVADAASPGAARLDGRMVDRPVVLQAQRTLALARD